ncbi:MAG: hypothetical protein Q8M83_00445, partial [bacterium]|nr:hypothetical protein [bacterium]
WIETKGDRHLARVFPSAYRAIGHCDAAIPDTRGRSDDSAGGLPRLDTLVLSMPLSWKGRLVQYAGRLHRRHQSKGAALIYDYVDENHAITNAMFRRRLAGYRELNYSIEHPQEGSLVWFHHEKAADNTDLRTP